MKFEKVNKWKASSCSFFSASHAFTMFLLNDNENGNNNTNNDDNHGHKST